MSLLSLRRFESYADDYSLRRFYSTRNWTTTRHSSTSKSLFDFDATISPQRQSDLTIIRQQRLDAECDYSILPAAKATFLSAIMATSQRIMVLGRSASSERLQRSVTTSARSWSAIVRFFMDDHRPFISTSTKTQRDRSPGPRCTIRYVDHLPPCSKMPC